VISQRCRCSHIENLENLHSALKAKQESIALAGLYRVYIELYLNTKSAASITTTTNNDGGKIKIATIGDSKNPK
jgi:hypothetical protein